jgi:hypothetical protein
MANKQTGYVEVELDKVRKIFFDLNALGELEERLGVPLDELQNVKLSIKNVRTLIWAGLIHEDEDLTEQYVGKLVHVGNLQHVQEKIALAMSYAKESKNG